MFRRQQLANLQAPQERHERVSTQVFPLSIYLSDMVSDGTRSVHCNFFSFFSPPGSGLCSVYRSEAGRIGENPDSENLKNNAHWLSEAEEYDDGPFQPQPSNTVAYYDAASLYPSSGEYHSSNLTKGGG